MTDNRFQVKMQEGDDDFLKEFMDDVEHLTGLVEEAFETDKVILLSQRIRQLIRDHARKTEKKRMAIAAHTHLFVDNMGKPLKERLEAAS